MINATLSTEQQIAVESDGNVLLTACPGSGKTRVIIHKLAHEIALQDTYSKKKIAAVTFTVRASEEIFRRLSAMGIDNSKIWSGTLHSFCYEWILKPYSCYLPELVNGYSIGDETLCSKLISDLKKKFGLKDIDNINFRFNRDGTFIEKGNLEVRVLKEYHKTLREKKIIDFELLLYYSYKILSKYPKIPKTLSHLFKLICVDEFQDTQDLLYAIICSIINSGEGNTSIFLVGDTDQAIYASLGGVAKNIDEIRKELNEAEITPLTLSGNYRSSQRIIDFYSNFQTEKIKITAVGQNANINGIITFNDTIESKNIVEEIVRLIKYNLENGVSEDEICVLVPQWWLITSITKKLRKELPDVNFDASGLTPMSKNRENIWYKLSRLFLTEPNPKIYSLRYRWANEIIEQFQLYTNTNITEPYSSPRNILRLINSIKSDKTEGIEYLNDCFDQFLKGIEVDYSIYSELVVNRSLYFKTIEERLSDPEFTMPSDIASFKSFYREMTGITINTCVGVKGEEFETVIVYGLLNGFIPHWNEIFSGNEEDAAKKLLYVICSRAKINLHLISECGRKTKKGYDLTTTKELDKIKFNYDII